ncbi:MAG: cell division protein ZapA [Sphingomonas sp.]
MATVELTIAGRKHELACRDGEEAHLRAVAAMVDVKASNAARAMGGMSEARQMLFAALMLADELNDARETAARRAAAPPAPLDPAIAATIEHLAERLEALTELLGVSMADGEAAGDGVENAGDTP